MGLLDRFKAAMREKEESARYFAIAPQDRPVTVYAEDDYTWNQLAGYVERLTAEHGRSVAYVTSGGTVVYGFRGRPRRPVRGGVTRTP